MGDEEDVNKMLEGDTEVTEVAGDTEERTALDDVFSFDSEMKEEEVEEVEGTNVRRRRETVSDVEEEFKECSKENQGAGVPLSSSCPETTSCSESSVTNSPNPRQTAKKGKKGKKKKR